MLCVCVLSPQRISQFGIIKIYWIELNWIEWYTTTTWFSSESARQLIRAGLEAKDNAERILHESLDAQEADASQMAALHKQLHRQKEVQADTERRNIELTAAMKRHKEDQANTEKRNSELTASLKQIEMVKADLETALAKEKKTWKCAIIWKGFVCSPPGWLYMDDWNQARVLKEEKVDMLWIMLCKLLHGHLLFLVFCF